MVIDVTEKNFEEEVLKSDLPVMVDFWAQWCGPCRMFSPLFEEAAAELEGKVKAVKINIDNEEKLSMMFEIMSIPTFMVFRGGQPVGKAVGLISKSKIIEMVSKS